MIKNIIFDWTGVINNNIQTANTAINLMFKSQNVSAISVEEMKREWIQPYMLFYNKYVPAMGIEEEQELYRLAYNTAKQMYPPKIFSGMLEAITRFKVNNIKMIIISSDIGLHLFEEIENYGLNGMFDEVFTDVHDKRVGLKDILKKFNFDASDSIFIGDTIHEVESGKSVGILTGAVTWGFQNEEDLKNALPDYIFHNVAEMEKTILE